MLFEPFLEGLKSIVSHLAQWPFWQPSFIRFLHSLHSVPLFLATKLNEQQQLEDLDADSILHTPQHTFNESL